MIARATGAPYRTQQLNDELHRLHARASSPSIATMAAACNLGAGTIHRIFSTPTLPKPRPLLEIVGYLAKCCYKVDPEDECDRFDRLYLRALDEWIPDPFAPDDPDDDDPLAPGAPPEPTPPKPSGPAGASPPPHSADNERAGESRLNNPPSRPSEPRNDSRDRALLICTDSGNAAMECGGVCCDAQAIADFGQQLAGYFPAGIETLRGPTRAEMWRALSTLQKEAGGNLLVYFCGHAIRDHRTSDVALLTIDSETSESGYVDNTMAMRDVRQMLADSSADDVYLIVDACLADENHETPMVLPARPPTPAEPANNAALRRRQPAGTMAISTNTRHDPPVRDAITDAIATHGGDLRALLQQAAIDSTGASLRVGPPRARGEEQTQPH
jgi:hypothetical protein